MGERLAKKVLLIGWDAADWKVINDLMDQGKMPALEGLVNRGVMGNIATLDPPLSPMLWTSIATGMRADKHGILGFTEPVPDKGGIRPVNITSRKVKAIWNILHHHGLRSNVVSWWPSHPAEPIKGVMVSNFFHSPTGSVNKSWPVPKGSVFPDGFVKDLRRYRIHPAELTEAHLLPFVPDAATIDQESDRKLGSLAKIISDAASIQAISTYLMEKTEWDFMAVYFDAIDHFCHAFMKYRPPKLDGIPDDQYQLYRDVVDGGYIFHDMMLERMIALAGEDTTIIIVSDHGFHSDHLRKVSLPKFPAAPAYEHRPFGIICMAGPHIKKDERIYGASLLDITPTILTLFGLPVGKDMDGKVLFDAFEKRVNPDYIPSWEKIEGDFGTHPDHLNEDMFNSWEAMKQLIELGYIDKPDEDQQKNMQRAVNEAEYNLSRVYLSSGNLEKATEKLENLIGKEGDDLRYNLDLIGCYLHSKRFSEAKTIIAKLRKSDKNIKPNLDLLEGILYAYMNKIHKALKLLKSAEKSNPALHGIFPELGKVYLNLRRYKDAEESYRRVLEYDDTHAIACHGLGVSLLRQFRYREAAEHLLTAIGLVYHFPQAHYHLGEALFQMGHFQEASQAFEVCLKMAPGMVRARRWLLKIYKDHLNEVEKSVYHQNILQKQMKGKITIVSGLPRSGTSMMMQILKGGGMDILSDQVREADENNPSGYFEYEKVKKLTSDHSFLQEAEGKAIKVIAHLLKFLPKDYDYKVIFMQRDMYEIIGSQQKMLGKSTEAFPFAIAEAFKKELEKVEVWSKKEPHVDLLYVNYHDILQNSDEEILRINDFLNFCLDTDSAIKQINPSQYRCRNTEKA